MAQIIASGKKIEFLEGITKETLKLQSVLSEGIIKVKNDASEINQSTFVKTYNAVVDGIGVLNEVVGEIADVLVKSANNWSSVPGLAQVAKVGFENALTEAKKLAAGAVEAKVLDMPDDLHENVTDELVKKFTTDLNVVMMEPREFLKRIAAVIGDTSTEDTKQLYTSIGGSVEKVTNAFVRAYNANKDELNKWNVALENIQTDTQQVTQTVMSSVENSTTVIEQKAKADII